MANDQQNQSTEEATPISDFFFGSKQYRKAIQDEFAARSAAANLSSAQSNVAQQQLDLVSNELASMKQEQSKRKVWDSIVGSVEDGSVESLNQLLADPTMGKAFTNMGIKSVETFNPNNPEHIQAYVAAGVDPKTLKFLQENTRYNNDLKAWTYTGSVEKDMNYVSEYGKANESGYLNPEELNTFARGLGVAYPIYRDTEGKVKAGDLQQLLAMSNAAVSDYNSASRNKVFDFIAGVNNSYKGITTSMQQYTEAKAQGEGLKAQGEGTQEAVNAQMMTNILNNSTLTNDQKVELLNKLSGKSTKAGLTDTAFSKNYEKLMEIDPTGKLAATFAQSTAGIDTKGTTFARDVEYLTKTYGPDVAKAFVESKSLSEGQIKEQDISKTKGTITQDVGGVKEITRISKLSNDNPAKVELKDKMSKLARQQGLNIDQFISEALKGASAASNFGDAAAQISKAEAGPIDNLVKQFKSYLDPNYIPSDAASLYNQVGIQMANTIFGATYTPSENAKFQDGFGSLSQQPGAIRSKAKAVLGSYLDTLNSLSAKISDPQLFAYHIQPRIDAINEAMAKLGKGPTSTKEGKGKKLTQKEEKIPAYSTPEEIKQANVKAGDKFYFSNVLMEIQLKDGKLVPVKVNK